MSTIEHLQFLHFDTYNQWFSTIQALISNTNSTPFNCTLNLPYQLTKVKKIYLKSVELPVGFYNIRAENGSNTLTITIGGTVTATITITPAQYTITTLIAAINTALAATTAFSTTNPNYLPVFSVSNQNVVITVPNTAFVNISLNNTVLTNIVLGFTANYPSILQPYNYVTSPANYNLAYDTYISIYFPNVNALSVAATGKNMTFKVPFSGTNSTIFYNVENLSFAQYIELTESNFTLSSIKLIVYDRFGYQINNNNLDWSFTLAFDRDTNPQTYY
jgi:hypothetical protein